MTFDLEHQTVPISMVKYIWWFQPQKLASLRLLPRKPRLSGTLWLHCQWHPQLGQVRNIEAFLTSAVSSRKITVKLLASRISASIFHHGPRSSHSFSMFFPHVPQFRSISPGVFFTTSQGALFHVATSAALGFLLGGSMVELQGELKFSADPSEASILIGATRNGWIQIQSSSKLENHGKPVTA